MVLYTKANFLSNLNYDAKIVCEMGPKSSAGDDMGGAGQLKEL